MIIVYAFSKDLRMIKHQPVIDLIISAHYRRHFIASGHPRGRGGGPTAGGIGNTKRTIAKIDDDTLREEDFNPPLDYRTDQIHPFTRQPQRLVFDKMRPSDGFECVLANLRHGVFKSIIIDLAFG